MAQGAWRAFELTVAGAGTALCLPFWGLCALALRLESSGPAFFRQERVGRAGVPFPLLKLRTMDTSITAPAYGITCGGDPRITRIGRLLRRYKLDETPQLLNVLRGEMSLVGPRPEVPRYVALYDSAQRAVLAVRPGITGAAALAYRNEEALLAQASDPEGFYVETLMPRKLQLELDYLHSRSPLGDLTLVAKTLGQLLAR